MEDLDLFSLPAKMEETPTCASAITASLGATTAVHSQLLRFMASNSRQNDAVKLLKEDIAEITATVMHLSESKEPSFAAKSWTAHARDLSYRIHDYFESIMCSGAEADAQEICGFRDLSKVAIERRDRYNLIDLENFCRRLPAIHADMIHHGRTEELAKKLDMENEKKLKVVPVVGPEGVGKTVLAKKLYRKIGRNFECRAFVRVSPDPDMRKLLTSIFIQIQQQQAIHMQREQASRRWDAQDLIEKIAEYLQNKRYLLIIDDLWTTVVWNIIRRAFPDGDCRSRIVTTTQIEDVALECFSQPEDEFKMIPLNVALESQNLFFHTVFGFEDDCSQVFQEVLHMIMRNFGGSPSAAINITCLHEQWRELMKEVVKLLYSNLPPHLKACLLYLNMYPEDYVIRKDELVKQWLAEGFICEVTKQDRVQIAGCYFDELVSRGMIQPVDKKYNKVLSCKVHSMVRELIAFKCKEQNFITCLDYCQSNVLLREKIHRLSVQFGGSKGADIPANIGVAELRSFAFFGFFECLSSIKEFSLLRVLVLHIWGDTDEDSLDLTGIGELSRLRYLKIVCNIMVKLPTKIQGLKCLETLEIDATETVLPGDIQDITSLHTLRCFDLSTNSINYVMGLQKLVNLQNLHLTCSRLQQSDLELKIECLGLFLKKLSSLESLTLIPTGSYHINPFGIAGVSSMSVSCDVLGSAPPASARLQRLELSRRYCIFSGLPEWTKDLSKLCILKIAVKVLSRQEIVVLGELSSLTALSLYVQTTIAEEIVLDEKGFRVLTYFKFICDAPLLSFRKGAMPNVRKLVLGINPNRAGQYDPGVGIRHLSGLKEISVKIGSDGADASDTRVAESALEAAFIKHPSNPFVSVQRIDWVFDIDNVVVHHDSNKRNTTRSTSGTPVASETSSPEQVAETKKEVKKAGSQRNEHVASSSLLASRKMRDDSSPEITVDVMVPTIPPPVIDYTTKDTHKYRLKQELKGDFVVGLAKCVLEGALTQVKSAIVLEGKLLQRAQLDLMFIADEFENMRSSLEAVDKERFKDIMLKNWVMQIQEMAYFVEDHMELIIDMGKKSRRWRQRRGLNPCMAATTLPPDDKVAKIAQIKARVEFVSRRVALNNSLVRVSTSKTVDLQQQQTAPTATAVGSEAAISMLVDGRDVTTTQQRLICDLTQLLTRRDDDDLQVISLWGTCRDDLGRTSIIRELYTDPEVCNEFKRRSWVKLTHPFDPIQFIRCLLVQFYATSGEERQLAVGIGILRTMEATGQQILGELMDHIYSDRYLVVLEDLSTVPQWDAIRSFLPDSKNGSRIIVSSQEFEIASMCVGQPLQVLQFMQLTTKHSVYAFHKEHRRLGERDKAGSVIDMRYASGDTISPEHKIRPTKEAGDDPMKNSALVGRDSEIGELHTFFNSHIFSSHVMSVWGIPGVGKSALVRKVFYKMKHGDNIFEKYGWVDVSHPFNLRDFSMSILRNNFHSERDIINPIQECIKFLQQYRCLIVIDNLESKEDWDLIQDALVPRQGQSTIIVITTEKSTATYCADSLELVFNVKGLDATAALDLFNNKVSKIMGFDRGNGVLRKLIHKCGGLPKVIIAVAGLLATKVIRWSEETADYINDKFMEYLQTKPEFDGLEELFCWMRSYFRKCPDFLMPCILYLSVFPGNHTIRRRRLVRRWIAEGYSRDSHERSSEEEGENIFSKLLDLSIIEQVPPVLNDTSMTQCQVNGFIHEYIISRQMEENPHVFKLGGSCALTTRRTGRHLIISEDWERDSIVFNSIDFSMLRSLTVFGKWQSFFVSKGMKLLRVLDLEDASGVTDDDLEEILMHLHRLKFLSLRGCIEIHRLPGSLGGLRQLQTLDIRHTSIRTIPANTTKLQKLQYIRAGATTAIPPCSSKFSSRRHRDRIGVKVPTEFGKLTMLHTLGVVNVRDSRRRDILNEIKKLTQLHKLGVSGINRRNSFKFFSAISGHVHLESLSIQVDDTDCLDDIRLRGTLKNLQSLKLYGLSGNLPKYWCDQITRVRKIHLEMAALLDYDIEQLGKLPELEVLQLRLTHDDTLKFHIPVDVEEIQGRSYQKVKILKICSYRLLYVNFGTSTMENLELLELDCSRFMGTLSGLHNLRKLKQVLLKGYYGDVTELRRLFAEHPNRPVLKLEAPLRSG